MRNKAVTCTYTNNRTSNKLDLQKVWGANAVDGDKANLSITGGITDPANATSVAPAAPAAGNTASTQVRSGAQVTVGEVLPASQHRQLLLHPGVQRPAPTPSRSARTASSPCRTRP